MSKYTEEQLADLTDAEREALLEDDGQPEIGNSDDLPADVDLDDDEDDDKGDDKGDGDGEGKAKADDDSGSSDDDDDDQDDARASRDADVPPLEAQLPDDFDQQMTALAEQKDALTTKFDDGEIGAREYQKQLDALNKQERDLERVKDRAELAAEMRQQQQKREWLREVNDFLAAHTEYTENELRYKVLDSTVREIAAAEPTLSGQEILSKAHEKIELAFGVAKKPKEEAAAKPAKPAANPRDKAPPTLAKVPAAETSGTENSKFAMLDRIRDTDPIRFEREMAKLSDSDRDAYLQSA